MDASPIPAAAQPPDPETAPHQGLGPAPADPEAAPQGVGPWNMPLTVCPTPVTQARPAFEDGTLAGVGPDSTGAPGEGPSQAPGPQGHGSVLKRRTGWVGTLERRKDQGDGTGQGDQVGRAGRVRRLATPIGILAAVAGAFAYVGSVDPNESGHYPVCPLLKLTGVLCPGCGGLRSAHAFIHGDLGAALEANAIATVGYFLFAAVWGLWLVRAWRGQPLRIGLAPVWWWGVGAVLLIFTVVRNLPFGSALAP
ncbi:DUF2752 domain-containing protein [Streptomyces anulatus]|uniref:DUF2752 domain-containing protein n=1 Tax=Streptomyces anulatus TaxID=1892 RepID=UPI0033C0D64B|nr:DUF2752 domain-containing protein [Streptomyces anulatus]